MKYVMIRFPLVREYTYRASQLAVFLFQLLEPVRQFGLAVFDNVSFLVLPIVNPQGSLAHSPQLAQQNVGVVAPLPALLFARFFVVPLEPSVPNVRCPLGRFPSRVVFVSINEKGENLIRKSIDPWGGGHRKENWEGRLGVGRRQDGELVL